MALQVWLPLTKDLRNQGLASLTSSGTPVFKNNGKLGNKSLDLNTRITFNCPAMANKSTFSVAFWAKVNTDTSLTTNWVDVIGFTDQTSGGSNGQLRWETCYASGSETRGISSHDNATNATSNSFGSIIGTTKGIWYHIACTVDIDNNVINEYRNGEVVHTITPNGGHLTGAFWIGETGKINGEIQDVRIYDHALSQMEIKELAKGLVLHYPLNRQGWGQENLLPVSGSAIINSTQSFEFQGWVQNFYTKTWMNEHLTPGKQYTLSYTVTCLSIPDSTYTFKENRASPILVHQGGGWSQITTTSDGIKDTNMSVGQSRDYKCTFIFATATENYEYYGLCGYTALYRNSSNNTQYAKFRIDNLKLEEGSIATPWCPNSSDALATTMGLNSTTEYDCSGFCNNGSKGGSTISYTSDTPKYAVSTQLIGTTVDTSSNTKTGAAYITGPCSLSNITALTVTWWAKIRKYGRGGIVDLTSWTSNYEEGTDYNTCPLSNWDSTFRLWDGTNAFNFFSYVLKDSTWHHYAVTFTSGSGKFYRDGVNIASSGTMGNTLTNFNGIRTGLGKAGGVYRQIDEDVSDLRIYATALSADDVKSLYQNCATIDPDGTIRGQIR